MRHLLGCILRLGSCGVVLLGFAVSDVAAQPCTMATAACSRWVSLDTGARSKVYATYPLDVASDRITGVLLVVHGGGRNADAAFRTGVAAATLAQRLQDTIVVAPRFASSQGACRDQVDSMEVSWGCGEGSSGGWRAGDSAVSHPEFSSFDLVDA